MTEMPPPPVKQQPPTMDDFDFPSLSASTLSKNKGSTKPSKSNGQHQQQQQQETKKHKGSNGSSSPVDALASQLEEKAKVSSPPLAKPTISYSATAAAAASKPVTPLQRTDGTEEQRRAFKLEVAPSSIPWLETGSSLNNEYLKSRAQAIEYGKARNRCFELATQAYLRNDGATAARLSSQGREYNDMMMATHREASQQIFNSRNQGMIKNTGKGETWIDLHGVHVDESVAFLDEFMEKLEKEMYTGTVYVVTGTGNHSSNSRAKVKPAIVDWLDSWGYLWKEMSLDKVHGGVLAVQVIQGKA
jgi:DNA-nicking Smr family endonuclease